MFRGTLLKVSTRPDGHPVALVTDLFLEKGKEYIVDHVWLKLKNKQVASVNVIKNNTPIRFTAKVKMYNGKYGLDLGNLYVWGMKNVKYNQGEYPE